MKYTLVLFLALAATWMFWSGHTDYWLLMIGLLSVLFTLYVCRRMKVVDQEGVPIQLLWGAIPYSLYLIKEIVVSNIDVAKIILSRDMDLHRSMLEIEAKQKTDLGNVILANSITLTPGTVSVSMDDDKILVHALSFQGAQEDLAGEMEEKISKLEGN